MSDTGTKPAAQQRQGIAPMEIELPVAGGEKRRFKLDRLPDGDLLLPSAMLMPDGKPRFFMPLPPRSLATDQAIAYLARHELLNDGYERGTREIIDAHVRPGDLFIDIGAHWGVMSFAAATRWPHNVRVLAFEAHPENASRLFKGVQLNKLNDQIEVFSVGVGARHAVVPIAFNTTMGHGLLPTLGRSRAAGALHVGVVSIDEILAKRPELEQRAVVMKIDVEGLEPEVIAGCRNLIASGRVKLIIWEKGRDFFIPDRRKAYDGMVAELSKAGYLHFSFPWQDWAGILTPDLPDTGTYNVYSFYKTEARLPHYQLRFASMPPYNPSMHTKRDEARDKLLTRQAARVRGSDGARWADPARIGEGAEARAEVAAPYIKPGQMVLDLGCGVMALRNKVPKDAKYIPADLIPRSADCYLTDLNQHFYYVDELFPAAPTYEGRYDWIVLSEVCEFLHDLPRVFDRCRKSSKGLIASYRIMAPDIDDAGKDRRRAAGYLNDVTQDRFEEYLTKSGWTIKERKQGADTHWWICENAAQATT
ncbi:MAG TPA: FkbM family methyltransferase [Reyranellaceae bacterium]|nr:FkbM family methyltransferase [Reyranellaceae bacterium]